MAKSKTPPSDPSSLPEPTTWARALVLGTGILGVSLSERALSVKTVEELGRKAEEAVRNILPSAKQLVDLLAQAVAATGTDPECDRLKTANSALSLCESIIGKDPPRVVLALATARLETSSSAVQASLFAAQEVIGALSDPLVTNVVRLLIAREKTDLSAAKYLREARSILRQDEMRRSLALELRMVAGAAQAYLASGMPSGGDVDSPREAQIPKSSVMASVVAPADVRIEARRGAPPPPPSQTRPKISAQKRAALSQTLASEGVLPLTRVGIERRGSTPTKEAALAMLREAMQEAEQKLDAAKGPIVLTVVVTVDVSDKGA